MNLHCPWVYSTAGWITQEPQIRKIMTTLVSICGGAEQAAYAIVWRPELLELESAASLRESLQAMRDHVASLVGCGWLTIKKKRWVWIPTLTK